MQKKRILQDVEYIKSTSYINLKRDLADTFKWFLVRIQPYEPGHTHEIEHWQTSM